MALFAATIALGLSVPTLNSIRISLYDIYKDYGGFFKYGLPELTTYIKSIDLEKRIELLKLLVENLSTKNQLIDKAIQDINLVLNDINTELIETKRRIDWNKTNWLKRSYRFYNTLKRVKVLVDILDGREKRLKEIISIYKCIHHLDHLDHSDHSINY